MTTQMLKDIEKNLEIEGLKPGSFIYEAELRRRKVALCQQIKAVDSCWDCNYFDHCPLIKQHLVDLRYHTRKPDGT